MKTKFENGFIMTDFTEEQKEQLLKVEVPRWIIEEEQIKAIKTILKLDDAESLEELRAIRNTAVKFIHEYDKKATTDYYWNLLSGTTAVIDSEMQRRFASL